jgi:hypothetical protein
MVDAVSITSAPLRATTTPSAEPIGAPGLNYPLTLLGGRRRYDGDFGGGAAATSMTTTLIEQGTPSRLLMILPTRKKTMLQLIPVARKERSSHPIDGDDWLGQDRQQ